MVLLNVFGSERNINKYLCYLYFFHDIILAHFHLKVKFIIISYISHRRQALTSTGFKSDEKNYKKLIFLYEFIEIL